MAAKIKGETTAPAAVVYHPEYSVARRKKDGAVVLRGEVEGKKFNLLTILDDGSFKLRPGNNHPAFKTDAGGNIRVSS